MNEKKKKENKITKNTHRHTHAEKEGSLKCGSREKEEATKKRIFGTWCVDQFGEQT